MLKTRKRSQRENVLNVLGRGQVISANTAQSRFGVKNLRSLVCHLRADGYHIRSIPKTRGFGVNYSF